MKKLIVLLLAAVMVMTLFACADVPPQTGESSENTVTVPPIPEGTICLEPFLYDSGISLLLSGDKIVLKEDGLDIELSADAVFAQRNGRFIAVMDSKPSVIDGELYLDEDFFNTFLCREGKEGISLFHSMLFTADEILAALEQPDASAFNQRLLEEVLLPASMGIEAPHVDMDRVFQSTPLSEYPDDLANALTSYGYLYADTFTYSEYLILTEAQSLAQAGMSFVMTSYPELAGIDPGEMTVGEYNRWQRAYDKQTFADGLTEEEKAFAEEKQIEISDLSHLNRVFYGAYMERSDEELRAALEEYYATDILFLQAMAEDTSE